MDNKQKKKILNATYRSLLFLVLLSIGWTLYLAIDKIVNKTSSIFWLDVTLIVVSSFVLIFLISDCSKTKNMKNKFGLAKYLFFITFNSIIGVIVGAFVFYYKQLSITNGYLFAVCLIIVAELTCIIIFSLGLKLSKLYQNITINIDSTSETPNFDDELMLKKKLDALNRKLEIKKVQEKIDNIQKELDE